ncbi:MAG: hypothetical protein HY341_01490 [Candidatus Kerfeldbacteria bacterium]|nr:hypothetical protein [Candidatus Kerfeldbacteria bacterium]
MMNRTYNVTEIHEPVLQVSFTQESFSENDFWEATPDPRLAVKQLRRYPLVVFDLATTAMLTSVRMAFLCILHHRATTVAEVHFGVVVGPDTPHVRRQHMDISPLLLCHRFDSITGAQAWAREKLRV